MATKAKNKKAAEAAVNAQLEQVVEMVNAGEVNLPKKKPGRPVNPNSERQKRLAEKQALIDAGHVAKRGRPVNPDSARQKRLAEQAARAEANGGVVKRGRPVNPNSERQKRLRAQLEQMIAQGLI